MEGLLYFCDCLYIPPHEQIKPQMLLEAHDIPIKIHPIYIKTYNAPRKSFWWKVMKKDLLSDITYCLLYERIKEERVKKAIYNQKWGFDGQ